MGAYFASNISFENKDWLAADDPVQRLLTQVNDEFSPGDSVFVGVALPEGHDFFSWPLLEELRTLSAKIANLPYFLDLKSPLESTVMLNKNDNLIIESFDRALQNKDIASLSDYKNELQNSHYYGTLISKDFRAFCLSIDFDINTQDSNNPIKRQEIMQALRALLAESHYFSDAHFAGDIVLTHQIDSDTKLNFRYLLPVSLFVMIAFLFFLFQSFSLVLGAFTIVFLVLLVNIVALVLMGHSLTVINVILPIIILSISCTDVLHIFSYWQRLRADGVSDRKAILPSLKDTALPCFLTSLTTAVGFGAFYLSHILPLKYFGFEAFICIFLSFLFTFVFSWMILDLLSVKKRRPLVLPHRFWLYGLHQTIFYFVQKYTRIIIAAGAVIVLFFSLFLVNFRSESNFLDVFFSPKRQIYQDFLFLDDRLGGSGQLYLYLKGEADDTFKDPRYLQELQRLKHSVLTLPRVRYMHSYLGPISTLHQTLAVNDLELPQDAYQLEQEFLFLEFSKDDSSKDVLAPYLDFTYKTSCIQLQTLNLNSLQLETLLHYLERQIKGLLSLDVSFTGSSYLFHVISSYILDTQLLSMAFTLFFIAVILLCVFGVTLGLIGFICTLIPILLVMGVMCLLSIPFDFATVLIVSIALGVCVDDVLHMLYHYKRMRHLGNRPAVRRCLLSIGKPVLFTTFVLMLGFMVFAFSNLVLLFKFGILTTVAIFLAWFSDVIVLPALLLFFKKC
ncbi:MAG: MMPL family transporter [bacterium]